MGRWAEDCMRIALLCVVATVFSACAETTECCVAQPHYALSPQPPPQSPPEGGDDISALVSALPASRVLVLQSTHIDRLNEVIGVVDVHAPMGRHDQALADLRMRAEQLGADAVLGVEFHHGHGEDEPTHLSGLAVRFLPTLP
jgi:hypothetical protein